MAENLSGKKCPSCQAGYMQLFGERASHIETFIGGMLGSTSPESLLGTLGVKLPRVVVYECNQCGHRMKVSKG